MFIIKEITDSQSFFNTENYLFFLRKMDRMLKEYSYILSYCLMPNHFHWMIKMKEESELTRQNTLSGQPGVHVEATGSHPQIRKIATLLSSYTQAINKEQERSGSLFRQKTKSIEITEPEYALICFLYIHQNPNRTGLCNNLRDWTFSSYRYANLRKGKLCDRKLTSELLDLPVNSDEFLLIFQNVQYLMSILKR